MKKKDSALWAACRLHRILSHAHPRAPTDSIPSLAMLIEEQKAVQRGWRMYQKAQSRGWTHTAGLLFNRLLSDIALVNAASKVTHPPRTAEISTVPEIVSEITHLQDEFDQVDILAREGRIEVTTDEITLEGVCLGTFCIQLHFARLAQKRNASAFRIIAEEANPASSNESCTHPHVSDESLCAGDATMPISNALAEGRIGDAFQLVNRVLHTYNASSAYVSMDEWDGRECPDCGRIEARDSLYYCQHCNQDFCDDCMRLCDACNNTMCCGCSTTHDNGDRLCPECKMLADQESEESDEEEEQTIAVSDDPIHDPAEEQPQTPSTAELPHEQSPSPDINYPQGAELPGGTTHGETRAITADHSAAQAA